MEEINEISSAVTAKDAQELCREVMSITDTMDVLRAKWNVDRLTEHGKRLYGIVYQMTEWGVEHRRLMLG